jgi:two-component system sensor histidine kinase/response regulator
VITQWLNNLARNLSIKSKVILVGVATASGGLLVALVALVTLTTLQHRTESKTELARVADMVAAYSSAPLLFGDKATATETLAGFERDDRILAAALYDVNGYLFATFERKSRTVSLIPSSPGVGYSSAGLDPTLFWPVELDGELLGTVYLRSDGIQLSSQINDLSMIVGLVMFICLLISIVISSKLQRVISDPILRLAGTAREVSANKTYSVRVVKDSGDEVGQLYDAFNGMLTQIEDRDEFLERQVDARTSELVTANEQLTESKERAEEADRLKGEFLANISHEIRTPMNIICGMTELTLETELSQKQRRNIEMVSKSSDSLLKLINQLLDFSKIEAGRMDLNNSEFNVRVSLGETLRALEIQAQKKDISLDYEIDSRIPARLNGDFDRLRQVVNNVVGNAIKFSDQGGQIKLTADPVWTTREETELHIRVADTGPGIAPEKQELIFKPFRQADGSVTRTHGGTGLGLRISKDIAELMGGRMWVESTLGEGSTFHVTVRLRLADPNREEIAYDAASEPVRAMIVDPSSQSRRAFADRLGNWGVKCALAGDVNTAQRIAKWANTNRRPFDFVVLDGHVPGAESLPNDWQSDMPEAPVFVIGEIPSGSDESRSDGWSPPETWTMLPRTVDQSDLWNVISSAVTRLRSSARPVSADSAGRGGVLKKVLLVEDNADIQVLTTTMLEHLPIQVTAVASGIEAIEALNKASFDAVLMDLQMPEMGGLEATELIRKSELASGRHTPIIGLTAHAMESDRQNCLAAGMDAYLAKPISQQQLVAALEAAFATASVLPLEQTDLHIA